MHRFIPPMTAQAMKADFEPQPGLWIAEEKYDGHRMCVSVSPDGRDLFGNRGVKAYSRNGLVRDLPAHLLQELDALPSGIYDAELMVPGNRSYGVTVVADSPLLCLYIFDVMEIIGFDCRRETWEERRANLVKAFHTRALQSVRLADVFRIDSMDDINKVARGVWDRDGEGLMLKKVTAPYQSGKRSKDWLKVKQLHQATMTITGFIGGRMGAHSIVVLLGSDGMSTTVKALNQYELDRLEVDPKSFIGKKLVIEYQERTPDGCYRHPRWDRWEDQ